MSLKHIAIIMDGNGRWATQRKRPRTFGHQAGVKAVRAVIESCVELNIPHLTLFAFSSENWSRPEKEVKRLMDLFMRSLNKETPELLKQGVKQNFIGDLSRFSDKLQNKMTEVASLQPIQTKLNLTIAVNYGGRWDMLQAARQLARDVKSNLVDEASIDEKRLNDYFSLANKPQVDLLIRTGGEHRISNFLLWQIAYAEIFFDDTLWPDFDGQNLTQIVTEFNRRERRFGQTSQQIKEQKDA
ncbi:polyprenyl diphosphate synthase [Marinicella sp. S1101]|uniref:polyprenyl diphosphate synthase n=1 Tax=Marinicella marina TaxID=2996016 RepID=UPI002260FFC5|nr:polyprenyl diphosphate synthase [Marinicella marina]MCX7554808.1 polyprenyl diphosphate synthase [Marinicella marina]MDJ1140959.1 polyprenyl diphosphate synthase [Marinicella marina]